MRAEIKADGMLHISAESQLEAYALKCWSAYFMLSQGSPNVLPEGPVPPAGIVFNTAVPADGQ